MSLLSNRYSICGAQPCDPNSANPVSAYWGFAPLLAILGFKFIRVHFVRLSRFPNNKAILESRQGTRITVEGKFTLQGQRRAYEIRSPRPWRSRAIALQHLRKLFVVSLRITAVVAGEMLQRATWTEAFQIAFMQGRWLITVIAHPQCLECYAIMT